ncbi:MAG: 4-hydroxybenzoate octaprenyltransferase [Thermoguttaceae bacterium]
MMLRRFLEMIRFSHTLFALPFAILAGMMSFAETTTPLPLLRFALGILFCMIFARSAAMSFNRWADQQIDARNPRTANRHIPNGQLSSKSVLLFTLLCSLAFLASSCLFLPQNPIPLIGSLPVLFFLLGYSFAKRFTFLSHFWLGISLMLAPIAAWVAVQPELSPAPFLLGFAVLFWVSGFDIIYATQDYEFDVQEGLKSIPARFGVQKALQIAAFLHLLMFLLLLALPLVYPRFGHIYYCGVGVIGLLLFAEHALIRPKTVQESGATEVLDLSRVNLAFFHLNSLISLGLLGIGLIDLFY